MAIPSVNMLSNEPGGGLIQALSANNALRNSMSLRKQNEIKEHYLPTTLQAENASKLAYARFMAPQFIAKIMQDPKFLGNLNEEQKNNLKNLVYESTTGPQGINALSQMNQSQHPSGVGQPSTNAFSGYMKNLFNAFMGKNSEQQQNPKQSMNIPENTSNQSYPVAQPSMFQPTSSPQFQNPADEGENSAEVNAYNEWMESPEGQREIAKGENANIPDTESILAWQKAKSGVNSNALKMTMNTGQRPIAPDTYAKNAGRFMGITEEGKEAGKTRNTDIDKLNTSVFNAQTSQETLDQISDILASPKLERIRNVPLAGRHELAYYAREGTPEEQELIGRYYTLTGNLIKDASRDFAGQFRKGEQQLLQGMKPSPGDTIDIAKGKTEALSVLNKMLAARSRETSKIMNEFKINKLEASELADKKINGAQIRKEVHDRLYPKVTLRDPQTGKLLTLTITEARRRGANV